MGGEVEIREQRKPRFLCLHGFRTSGHILKTQLDIWPQFVLDKLDLVFPDAPFPGTGNSGVDGIFDPPYYEWFQANQDFTEFTNFDECLEYIQEYMIKHGPFDGLLGFSQGSFLSVALPGLQTKGLAITKVPKIKFLIIISGGKFNNAAISEKAFSDAISCPTLHFIGEMDFLKPSGIDLLESFVDPIVIHHPEGHTVPRLGEMDFLKPSGIDLLESFVDPIVIHHPEGHTVPRLDEKGLESVLSFIEKIQKVVTNKEGREKCLEEAP